MDAQNQSRTFETDIGGTVYVVESCVSESAKESAYTKLKRLITANAKPYGYLKNPEDKFKWIIDEKAAEVVREIFRLCMAGFGIEPHEI